ncbi:MAG: EAL domain-containing protein, partial [Terracidiphilus sp.]
YAPVIVAAKFVVEGPVPLPVPIQATPELAAAGLLDSQFVSIEGVVHPLKFAEQPYHPVFTFALYTSLGQVHVFTAPGFPDLRKSSQIEDARVRMQGVFSTVYNQRRQLVGYQLQLASPANIQIIEPAVADPLAMPATPIGSLLRYSHGSHFGHRVKIAGAVTMAGNEFVYVQDQSGGVQVGGDVRSVHLGQRIEAVGYPTLAGRYSPVLSDAVFRSLPGSDFIQPQTASADVISHGNYDAQLVTIEGRLLAAVPGPGSINLLLQSGIQTFTAELDLPSRGGDLADLRAGSVLRLTGVASAQIDSNNVYQLLQLEPVGFKLLLRVPEDVTVIRAAPYWTSEKTLGLLALLLLLIVVILAWVAVLRRRVARQRIALEKASQTAQAIHDLSAAMEKVPAEQKFDARVSVRGSQEIAGLVVGFNAMLAQLLEKDNARRDAETRLMLQATIDDLTGLPNRRVLADQLSQSMARARREQHMLGLLYIDLDGFKLVNDSFGHAAGDRLLVEVGQRLSSRVRQSDTLARIGGDEFTVILHSIRSRDDAQRAAESVLESLVNPFHVEGHEITIGASIGISIFPDANSDNDNLLQQADSAMYSAKRNGKNRIVHFSNDMGVSVRERLTLENELRRAVANGEIEVHYQPEFDLATNAIVRFEALARWTHPTLGAIPPLSFISVAEDCGLIVPLGAHVMERACRDALLWQQQTDAPVQVAVNVSSVQFARDSFVQEVLEILVRTGLPANLLQIELTESATLIGIERAAATIRYLKELGVSVVMDDFGSGYSSLSYLPKFPFNALKIDRSFVSQLPDSGETQALVHSIITLGHNLGMKIIVEGIETHAQLQLMRQLGGDEAQGYLLGRPTP